MSTLGSMISWIRNFPGVAQGHYRHFLVGFVTSPWQVFRQQAISTSTVLCRKKNTVDSQVAGIRLGYIIQVIPVYNTIIQCLVWWFLWYYNSRNAHVRYHLIFGLYSQVLWLTFKHLAENRRLVAGFLFPSGQKWNHQKSLYHHVSPYIIHVLLQISWFIVYLDIVYPYRPQRISQKTFKDIIDVSKRSGSIINHLAHWGSSNPNSPSLKHDVPLPWTS